MAEEKTAPTGLPERVGYYVLDKDSRVFGIDADGNVEQIVPTRGDGERVRVHDLYTVDGDIYLIEREAVTDDDGEPTGEYEMHYWRQAAGASEFVAVDTVPDKPLMQRIGYEGDNYSITIDQYNDEPLNIVHRPNKPDEPLYYIEQAVEIDRGLVASVREGRGTVRPAGLAIFERSHPHEYKRLRRSDALGRLWLR